MFATKADAGNPYAIILYEEIRRRGTRVVGLGSWNTRDLLKRPAQGARILHLQWGDGWMFAMPGRVRVTALLCRYLLKLSVVRLGGVRIVWTFHNDLVPGNPHPRLASAFQWLLIRFVASRTAVLTPGARELVRARYGARAVQRVHLVPHPTYEGVYGPAPTRSDARQHLGLPPDTRVLLYFGLISPYKGVPDLLQAFSSRSGVDAILVVAGRVASTDLQIEIERTAAADPRVLLRLNHIPDEEVALLVTAADVVVLPYRNTLNSGVLYLAVTYDRPVVAPRMGVFGELASLGELPGVVYDPGGLGEAIVAALDATPEDHARWARAMARHRAAGESAVVADLLMGCYQDALS